MTKKDELEDKVRKLVSKAETTKAEMKKMAEEMAEVIKKELNSSAEDQAKAMDSKLKKHQNKMMQALKDVLAPLMGK